MNDDIDRTFELLKRSSFEYTFKEIELVLGITTSTWKDMIEHYQSRIGRLKKDLEVRTTFSPEVIYVLSKNGWTLESFNAEYRRRLQQILDAEE